MSISSVTSKVVYVGTGSTAAAARVFAYPFKILAATDLTVSEYNNTTSAAIVKTLSTHYDVSGVGSSGGGNVTITGSYTNLPTGCQLVIQRIMDLTQETDYVENDAFSAETHETALDRLTMITQQLQEQLDRAVLADITQTSPDLDVIANANAAKSSAVVAMGVANSLDRFDDGSQGTENLLSNGDFENWSAGTSVAPDGWLIYGASSTVAREASTIKLGTYSAKLTRVGNDCVLYQINIHVPKGITYWKDRKITYACWVYATVASRARLLLYDGVQSVYSSYHTGDSTWQWLTVTITVNASATEITPQNQVDTGNTSAYFDGAMCVEGESIFAFCEKPLSVDKLSDTFKNINPTNLLSNGDFENWSAGTSVAPDGWALGGAGASVARESSIIKLGTYSAKVTRAGTDCYLYNTNYNVAPILGKGIEYWKGRKITIGCWVYATVAARARLSMTDNVNTANSSYHTGDSTWQWLTMTMTFDSSATLLVLYLQVNNGNTSAYFDGAMCVEGESIFAFSPKPLVEPILLTAGASVLDTLNYIQVNIDGTNYKLARLV